MTMIIKTITKVCPQCKQEKTDADFTWATKRGKLCLSTYCKACQKLQRQARGPDYYKDHAKAYKQRTLASPSKKKLYHARKLIDGARTRAKNKNLKITIDEIWIDNNMPSVCPVLKIPLTLNKIHGRDSSPSIDRIDNRGGYIEQNSIIVSNRVNRIKQDATPEELTKIAWFYSSKLQDFVEYMI